MIKKIILIALIITNLNLPVFAGLTSTHWKTIVRDIARDGDAKDRNEFEAARQAFLHIKDETDAKIAAQDIQKKWKATFGTDATVGSKTRRGTLMSLTRYPLMTKEQAKKATLELLKQRDIAQFLDEQKFKAVSCQVL